MATQRAPRYNGHLQADNLGECPDWPVTAGGRSHAGCGLEGKGLFRDWVRRETVLNRGSSLCGGFSERGVPSLNKIALSTVSGGLRQKVGRRN